MRIPAGLTPAEVTASDAGLAERFVVGLAGVSWPKWADPLVETYLARHLRSTDARSLFDRLVGQAGSSEITLGEAVLLARAATRY